MDCAICGAEIKTGLMGKIKGTYVKVNKKLRPVCSNCQKDGEESVKSKLG